MNYELRYNFPRDASCLREILRQRKVEDVDKFLHPTADCELSPTLLDNVDKAIDVMWKHIKKGNRICIVVDCDCDGYTSASLLWLYIKNQNPKANLSYVLHTEKQHGLEDQVERLVNEKYDLVILPDAGSFDGPYLQQLNEVGTEVVAADHHSIPADYDMERDTPPNTTIVNNQLCDYPNKELCGVGVVYKVCRRWDERFNTHFAPQYKDLVALGNIADVMFMGSTETRFYIMDGLNHIQNEGFRALIRAQHKSLKDKIDEVSMSGMSPQDVGFLISPLINAIIRMGSMEEKELLFISFIDPHRIIDGKTAAETLCDIAPIIRNRQNATKKRATELLEYRIYEQGLNDNNIIVVEAEDEDHIPNTLTGLIAGDLLNKFNRPVMLVRESDNGELRGSQRSNANFEGLPDFRSFLENSGYIISAVGHPNASGVNMKKSNLKGLLNYANKVLDSEKFQNLDYQVDYVFHAYEEGLYIVGMEVAAHDNCFGNGVDEVKCVVRNVPLASFKLMGTNQDSTKITCNGIDYIKFKDLDFAQMVLDNCDKSVDVYGKFRLNEWAGRQTLQILIEDYELNKQKDYKNL